MVSELMVVQQSTQLRATAHQLVAEAQKSTDGLNEVPIPMTNLPEVFDRSRFSALWSMGRVIRPTRMFRAPKLQQKEELVGLILRLWSSYARLALSRILPLELRSRGEKTERSRFLISATF